jgi:hypothetical protein
MEFDLKGSIYHRTVPFSEEDNKWWLEKLGHKKGMKCRNFVKINDDLSGTLVNFEKT